MGETRTSPGSGYMSVDQVEHELARLRMNEDGTLGLRSSVLNLIVVTDERSADRVTGLVSGLSGRFPLRAVVLISDPDQEEANVDIWLSAFCSTRGGGSQVCAEQITIHAEGSPAHHLESLAGPLLIPDLPVFLFYPGAFAADSPEFRGVASLADRLIVDSGVAENQRYFLREVSRLVEGTVELDASDLQWVALTPWRALVADLFNPADRARKLNEIERVEILHNPRGESRALLLAGWLASTLEWSPESIRDSTEGCEFVLSGPSGEVVISMGEGSPRAALQQVRLQAAEMSFQVSRCREPSEARATVMRGDELLAGRTVHLGYFDPESVLGEELQYRGQDEGYRAALEILAEMLGP